MDHGRGYVGWDVGRDARVFGPRWPLMLDRALATLEAHGDIHLAILLVGGFLYLKLKLLTLRVDFLWDIIGKRRIDRINFLDLPREHREHILRKGNR